MVGKIRNFRPISRYISEMVQDRPKVTSTGSHRHPIDLSIPITLIDIGQTEGRSFQQGLGAPPWYRVASDKFKEHFDIFQ